MGKYEITLNYDATFHVIVEAKDEGDAYDKARNLAENADMNEFMLGVEKESRCNYIER
jgi:hypothetical protein